MAFEEEKKIKRKMRKRVKRQTDIKEFDAYPHVERDQSIVRAIHMADEPALRKLLGGNMTLDDKIRIYSDVSFQGSNVYSWKSLSNVAVWSLAKCHKVESFTVLVKVLAPASSIASITHVLRLCAEDARYGTWMDGNPSYLFAIVLTLVQCGAHFNKVNLSGGAPINHYGALAELVASRNYYRTKLVVLMGIAKHRRSPMPWQILMYIAGMIKLPT